jgi:hypothetical protein
LAWNLQDDMGIANADELGGNLLSKYSMVGRFFAVQESLDFLQDAMTAAIPRSLDLTVNEQISAAIGYLRCVLLHSPFSETLQTTPVWTTSYDIELWSKENYSKPLASYDFGEERNFRTAVDPEHKAVIENRLRTFGEHPSGMGKLTRTMFAREMRRALLAMPASVGLAQAKPAC